MMRLYAALAVIALPAVADAEGFGFDYDFVEIGYSNVEIRRTIFDGDGFSVGGSLSIADSWFVFGGYQAAEFDLNIDRTSYGAGVGYYYSVNESLDLVTSASWQYVELEEPSFGSLDDSGIGLAVGFRMAASRAIEFNAGLEYVDVLDSGDNTSLTLRGLYNFNKAFTMGISGSWNDDEETYTLGARLYFGGL